MAWPFSRPPDDPAPPVPWAPVALLTGAGGMGLGMGLLGLLTGAGGFGPGPIVVGLLGGGTLVGGLMLPRLVRAGTPVPAHPVYHGPPPGAVDPCPTCRAREEHLERWAAFDSFPIPAPPHADARTLPFVAQAATGADRLWSSWVVSEGELPVGLVGPVPETAYVAPRSDDPELFADRAPALFVDLRSGEMLVPPGTVVPDGFVAVARTPPSGGPGAALIPVVAETPRGPRRTAPLAPSDEALPVMVPVPEEADYSSRWSAGFTTGSADQIRFEATTPVPPHLRGPAPSPPRPPSRKRPAVPTGGAGPTCATCRSAIAAPTSWRRCHDCSRPLCHACLVSSLIEQEQAWCASCATAHGAPDLDVGS